MIVMDSDGLDGVVVLGALVSFVEAGDGASVLVADGDSLGSRGPCSVVCLAVLGVTAALIVVTEVVGVGVGSAPAEVATKTPAVRVVPAATAPASVLGESFIVVFPLLCERRQFQLIT